MEKVYSVYFTPSSALAAEEQAGRARPVPHALLHRLRGTIDWCVEHRWKVISPPPWLRAQRGQLRFIPKQFSRFHRLELMVKLWLPKAQLRRHRGRGSA